MPSECHGRVLVFFAHRRLGTGVRLFECRAAPWFDAYIDRLELSEVEAGIRARLCRRQSLRLAVAAKAVNLQSRAITMMLIRPWPPPYYVCGHNRRRKKGDTGCSPLSRFGMSFSVS